MIEKAEFGRTGHLSTRILFGGAALGKVSQKEADETLDLLFEYGINHIDTAASYGEAELRIGPWMEKHRDKFFLATKTEKRTYKEAWEEIENSRKRMRVDVIDLWQMHVLVDEEGWQTAMGKEGALEAFIEAREKGIVKYLGVTGHGVQAPLFHMRSLEKFDFDSVLLPWNYPMSLNKEYTLNFNRLAAVCDTKKVALQTIKGICRRPWPEGIKKRDTWYEPLEDEEAIQMAIAYILGDKQKFLNSLGDIHVLPRVLKAARYISEGKIPAPGIAEMEELAENQNMAPLFC